MIRVGDVAEGFRPRMRRIEAGEFTQGDESERRVSWRRDNAQDGANDGAGSWRSPPLNDSEVVFSRGQECFLFGEILVPNSHARRRSISIFS